MLTPQAVQAEVIRRAEAFTEDGGRQVGVQAGHAVTRGLKSVGRSVGRLFGRKPR
jgi:hypothetical protein